MDVEFSFVVYGKQNPRQAESEEHIYTVTSCQKVK